MFKTWFTCLQLKSHSSKRAKMSKGAESCNDTLFDALRNFIDMVCLEVGSPTVQYTERKIGDSRTNMIVGRN